jgi:hypothetical protein
MSRTLDVAANYTRVVETALVPEMYSAGAAAADVSARFNWRRDVGSGYVMAQPSVLGGRYGDESYAKAEGVLSWVSFPAERLRTGIRLYGATSSDAMPAQRALVVNTPDQVTTYWGHYGRPRGALLKRPGFNSIPLGGAALRGFAPWVTGQSIGAVNADAAFRLGNAPHSRTLSMWAHAFADAGYVDGLDDLTDAGVGISMSGRLFDKNILVRLDAPVYVNRPALTFPYSRTGSLAPRWLLTFNDIW